MTTHAADLEETFAAEATMRRPNRGVRMEKAVLPPNVGVGGFLLPWPLLVTVLHIPHFELPAHSALLPPTRSDPPF